MIDFRYHLVSLVSVFIALAVGVVLGAGPLRGGISDTLESRVENLRLEQNRISAERDAANAAVRDRDEVTRDLVPIVVRGMLPGRAVLLVTLPGADGDLVDPLTTALTDAGATPAGRVDLKESWVRPDAAADRAKLAATWAPALTAISPLVPPAGQPARTPSASATTRSPSPRSSRPVRDADGTLQALLGRVLLTANPLEVGQTDPTGQEVLDAFGKAGLLSASKNLTRRAAQVVVLAPAVAEPAAGASPSPSSPEPAAWAQLIAALDRAGTGAVVLAPDTSATAGGVLEVVRADAGLARQISSVDTAGSPMGDIATVLALVEQGEGAAGHYGFADGATEPLPPRLLTAAR